MAPPFALPEDVVEFIGRVFAQCNARIASRLSYLPTLHETHLDLCFIETLSGVAAPHVTSSGYIIDVDVHYLGQGRHWESWEVADLGFIVTYRRAGTLLRTKVALLQSKRLYPRESEFVEDEPISKYRGFADLHGPPDLPAQEPREFRFDASCRYRALQVGDDQWHAIGAYEAYYGIPVHYLLYHPRSLPSSQIIPVPAGQRRGVGRPAVGCRILRATDLRATATGWARNYAPSYGDFRSALGNTYGNGPHRVAGLRSKS